MKGKYLFTQVGDLLNEADKMFLDDYKDRNDRATAASFYNGAPPAEPESLKSAGYIDNTNFMTFYDNIGKVFNSLVAFWVKPRKKKYSVLFNKPNRTAMDMRAEQLIQEVFNKALTDNIEFKAEFKTMMANALLHGTGIFMFLNKDDVFPCSITPDNFLVPRGSSTSIKSIRYICVVDSMTIQELEEKKNSPKWHKEDIERLIAAMKEEDKISSPSVNNSTVDSNEQKEAEAARMNVTVDDTERFKCRVYRFYQTDDAGKMIGVKIVTRGYEFGLSKPVESDAADPTAAPQSPHIQGSYQLYEDEFDGDFCQYIVPFHLDFSINDRDHWHAVLGLGTISLSTDANKEYMINRVVESAKDGLKTLYKSEDDASREVTDGLVLSNNSILPKHMTVADKKQLISDIRPVIGVIQMMDGFSGQKSGSSVLPSPTDDGDYRNNRMMDEMQGSNEERRSTIYADVSDSMNQLGRLIFQRMLKDNDYKGYGGAGLKDIVNSIRSSGGVDIPVDKDICVDYNQIVGFGSRRRRLAVYQHLAGSFDRLPPQSRSIALNIMTEIASDDQNLADMIAPIEDDGASRSQEREALQENAIAITQQLPIPISRGDVDAIHMPHHIAGCASIIDGAGGSPLTMVQYKSFLALSAHSKLHIENLIAVGQRDAAAQFTEQVMGMAKIVDELAADVIEQAEGGGQNQNADQMLKMKDSQRKDMQLQLQVHKARQHDAEFSRKQDHKEDYAAMQVALAQQKQELERQTAAFQSQLQAQQVMIDELKAVSKAQPVQKGGTK